jgi:hypothetical protein
VFWVLKSENWEVLLAGTTFESVVVGSTKENLFGKLGSVSKSKKIQKKCFQKIKETKPKKQKKLGLLEVSLHQWRLQPQIYEGWRPPRKSNGPDRSSSGHTNPATLILFLLFLSNKASFHIWEWAYIFKTSYMKVWEVL